MKRAVSSSTYWVLGILLILSALLIAHGCREEHRRGAVTSPTAKTPLYLNVGKGLSPQMKVTGLTLTVTDQASGAGVSSQAFADPTFPVNTSLNLTTPPCTYLLTATAVLTDGTSNSDSVTVDACAYTGGTIILSIVTEEPKLPVVPLTVTKTGPGQGTITTNPDGIACGAICTGYFEQATSVTLTAIPAYGYIFTGWSGGGCSGTVPCTIWMMDATTVTARFDLDTFSLSVSKTGTGTGTVTSSLAPINCGTTCNAIYPYNTALTLTAAPDAGVTFMGWTGACSGTGACALTINGPLAVTAQFDILYALNVTTSGTGTGTVTSAPAGFPGAISCGATCTTQYIINTAVTLTAVPDANMAFVGWTGDCTGTGACNVTMDAVKNVDAQFEPIYQLSVTKSGSGTGTVTAPAGVGAGINCGATCSEGYINGTSVTLTATPDSGMGLLQWTGCAGTAPVCAPTTSTCSVTMNAPTTVDAQFEPCSPVNASTTGGYGTETVAGMGTYPAGATVNLTASHNPAASTFVSWAPAGGGITGWCNGQGEACTIFPMPSSGVTEQAIYTVNSYTLSVSVINTGTVTSDVGGINCLGTCSDIYPYNTIVTLTATPGGGYAFTGWSGACSGTGGCSVTMTAARSVTAQFDPQCAEVRIYYSGTMTSGNLAGTADALCATNKPAGFSNSKAFVPLSGSISSIVPSNCNSVPVTGSSGTISSTWTGLWDGSIDQSLDAAGVMPSPSEWWTGSNSNGTTASTCLSWTSGVSGVGTVGVTNASNSSWVSVYLQNCNRTDVALLCVAW
jgi:hypothetical protein